MIIYIRITFFFQGDTILWKHNNYAYTWKHNNGVYKWKQNKYASIWKHEILMYTDLLIQYHNSYASNKIITENPQTLLSATQRCSMSLPCGRL